MSDTFFGALIALSTLTGIALGSSCFLTACLLFSPCLILGGVVAIPIILVMTIMQRVADDAFVFATAHPTAALIILLLLTGCIGACIGYVCARAQQKVNNEFD